MALSFVTSSVVMSILLTFRVAPAAPHSRLHICRLFVESIDVGDPEEIRAFLYSAKPWRCQRMTVWKDFRYWMFDCINEMNPGHREAVS